MSRTRSEIEPLEETGGTSDQNSPLIVGRFVIFTREPGALFTAEIQSVTVIQHQAREKVAGICCLSVTAVRTASVDPDRIDLGGERSTLPGMAACERRLIDDQVVDLSPESTALLVAP
jgi:hypothetical protein